MRNKKKKKKAGSSGSSKKLLRIITSNHHGDFYCLNCLHSFRTENKLTFLENVCKNKDSCGIAMLSEKGNVLKFN